MKDSPSVLDDIGWGSVSIGGAGSAEPLLLAWDAYHKLSMVYDATVLTRPLRPTAHGHDHQATGEAQR